MNPVETKEIEEMNKIIDDYLDKLFELHYK